MLSGPYSGLVHDNVPIVAKNICKVCEKLGDDIENLNKITLTQYHNGLIGTIT